MIKQSPAQVGAEIQKYFPHFGSDKQKHGRAKFKGAFDSGTGAYMGDSALFHDLCNIGALLTDEVVCLKHLGTLSELMVEEFVKLNSQDSRIISPTHTPRAANRSAYTGKNKEAWLAMNPPKFGGILKKVLTEKERKWGFNGGDAQPQEVPTLSDFVHPQSFNDLLLRQKKHWKDPGASISHGEYTHRLQWWIICLEDESKGQYRLKKPPAQRFKQLPKYVTSYWRPSQLAASGQTEESVQQDASNPLLSGLAAVYTNRSLWDFLCDSVATTSAFAGTTPSSDSFRAPDYMNLYLTDPARAVGLSKISMLHNYLVARYNKRTWQDANNMLQPHRTRLSKKWGITEEKYDELFADEDRYGKVDEYATVRGKVVTRPHT